MQNTIVLAPEIIFHIGPLPITNTLFTSWIVMIVLIILSKLSTKNMSLIPNGLLRNIFELTIEGFYDLTESLAHSRAAMFFPFLMTFFLYIVIGNWLGLFPGFSTIGFFNDVGGHMDFIPLLRSMNTDLNMTLALALISAFLTHFFSIRYLGIKGYLAHWFNLNPLFMFVGILEIISEVTKVISLSFRLFGNIFAGEVVMSTISTLAAFFVPLPFYFLEILAGVIQAAVFMILTMVFMVLLTEKHIGEEESR